MKIPRVIFSYGEEDKKLYEHSLHFMRDCLAAAGGKGIWDQADTAHLLGGCRMGTNPPPA